ncbi:MAG: cysteine peptidase family C39 domain-containing protein [Chloroflexota bacterium]|nr:cysteine peptidase family C39 domain-containing protein [Chloroflexota bacterium]
MPNVLLPIPHYKQSRPGACLPACVRMVLGGMDDEIAETHLARVMGSYWFGTPASHVLHLSSIGYRVTYERTTFAQLRVHIARQVPCIVFLRTGGLPYWDEDVPHAVVAVEIGETTVHLHDPALDTGPTTVDATAFLLAWAEMDYYCATIEPGLQIAHL